MPRIMTCCVLLIALLFAAFANVQGQVADPFKTDADAFLRSVVKELGIPGLAVTVVKDGKVVIAEGYGMADLENKRSADGATCYYIASATKPLTALLAAILDAEGTLKLNDPLGKYYPALVLDSIDLNKVLLRDLLTHTSGLDNAAISWRLAFSGEHDPALLDDLMKYCTPNEAGYGNYEYTNVGYNIYGMVVQRATGRSWKDLLKEKVFGPAGMTRTTAYISLAQKNGWTIAKPYSVLSTTQPIPLEKQDNTMQSAGGLITTSQDMARWLQLHVNEGMLDGKQVIPAAVMRSTSVPLVKVPGREQRMFAADQSGAGWLLGSYKGEAVVHHSGGFAGHAALTSFMPGKRMAVAVMVNEDVSGGRLADMLAGALYDQLLVDGHAFDMSQVNAFAERLKEIRTRIEAGMAQRAQRPWTLSKERSAYAGRYTSAMLGTMEVRADGSTLQVSIGNLHCTATAYTEPETIRVELIPGRGEVIGFRMTDGRASGLRYNNMDFNRID